MSSDSPLDDLPLDVLLALQEALADPSRDGVERARLRAADAGFWLQCDNDAGALDAGALPPLRRPDLPMSPAPPGATGVPLDLSPDAGATGRGAATAPTDEADP